ncbi:tRNA (guanine46-N7-)-methyltransferase [hydrothermal vent metagenome]|uniref:tRNA (guanine(46)-N(7))-methyltransferase n=1 Tax=hydrothermal vent metagenome TaxID=652676 RepID=A0A1W1CF02_9ZZZZ
MPHIKIKKIDSITLANMNRGSDIVKFVATPMTGDEILYGIEYKGEEFLIQLKRDIDSDMLKYDKVSRPLKVNLIKEVLALLSDEFALEVVASNISLSTTKPPLSSKYFKKIEEFDSIEFPFESISIEVGFGSGRHLLYQATQNPDRLYIGLEIHTPSAQQVLKQIELQGLENIWVVNYDARLFLEMLPSNLCSQIFVHFPVPWDKKPQRRVISPSFLDESLRVLALDGRLELRTDSYNYFWYSMESIFALHNVDVHIVKNNQLAITSKYEERWRKQEKDIYEVHLISHTLSEQVDREIEFSFGGCKYREKLEENIPSDAIVEESFFIHFERIYTIGEGGLLIKCAFGSFDRPEHKYIIIDQNNSRYYPSTPVKTDVNYKAHKKIMEYLKCQPIL